MDEHVSLHVEIRRLLKAGNVAVSVMSPDGKSEISGIDLERDVLTVYVKRGDLEVDCAFEFVNLALEPPSCSALRVNQTDLEFRIELAHIGNNKARSDIQGIFCCMCENRFLKDGVNLRRGIDLSAKEMEALFSNMDFFCHAHGPSDQSEVAPNLEPAISEFMQDTSKLTVRIENKDDDALIELEGRLLCSRCRSVVGVMSRNIFQFDVCKILVKDGEELLRRSPFSDWLFDVAGPGRKLCIYNEGNENGDVLLLQVMDGDLLVISRKLQVDYGNKQKGKVWPARCAKVLYRLESGKGSVNPWKMDPFAKSIALNPQFFKELLDSLSESTLGLRNRNLKSVNGFLVAYIDKNN